MRGWPDQWQWNLRPDRDAGFLQPYFGPDKFPNDSGDWLCGKLRGSKHGRGRRGLRLRQSVHGVQQLLRRLRLAVQWRDTTDNESNHPCPCCCWLHRPLRIEQDERGQQRRDLLLRRSDEFCLPVLHRLWLGVQRRDPADLSSGRGANIKPRLEQAKLNPN